MKKITIAVFAAGLLALPAFAQEAQLHAEVENTLRSKGVEVEVPDDLSNAELAQLLAIANDNSKNETQMKEEVDNILGM